MDSSAHRFARRVRLKFKDSKCARKSSISDPSSLMREPTKYLLLPLLSWDSQMEQIEILTGITLKTVLADRGYCGVVPSAGSRLLISHTRRLPKRLKKLLKRRQVVEPMIGHMKSDGILDRNWLKGALGDAMHAVMCGAGPNLRMILAHLRVLLLACAGLLAIAAVALRMPSRPPVLRVGG
jgi:transposase, IS5 family